MKFEAKKLVWILMVIILAIILFLLFRFYSGNDSSGEGVLNNLFSFFGVVPEIPDLNPVKDLYGELEPIPDPISTPDAEIPPFESGDIPLPSSEIPSDSPDPTPAPPKWFWEWWKNFLENIRKKILRK